MYMTPASVLAGAPYSFTSFPQILAVGSRGTTRPRSDAVAARQHALNGGVTAHLTIVSTFLTLHLFRP